ncbi:MAG TPA: BatD family protein [Pseudomonadales bacterium]|nr:BatD family protein [Pseudomonadales bacterium]
MTGHYNMAVVKAFFIATFCLLMTWAAGAANFTASLDRDSIQLGETVTLSLTFQGGQPRNVPRPDVPGLQIVNAGNSSSFSFDNGQMSSSVVVSYSIAPQQAGDFTIPALTAEIGGQQFTTQPMKLKVSKPGAPSSAQINSGSELAFMRLIVPEKTVYPGQVISVQAQVFFRDDVQNMQGFQFTALPADGFTVGKMVSGGRQQAQIGNRNYTVFPISLALTVLKPGTLTVGPVSASVMLITGGQNFGFMGLVGGEQRQVALTADPITIQSLPLPTQNVPPSFNGAVGDYTMTFSAGPTNLAVGDPITMRVQISGHGTLDSLTLPNQAGWNDFKTFSPTSKFQANDGLEDQGTKTFEQIVTPQNASVHELPAFAFSYFNPEDGTYHTLTQPATPLTVSAVAATPLPTIATPKQPAAENQTPQDIVPIRENLGALARAGTPWITRPAFLALQAVPVLAFFSALVWRKRTDNLANNPRLRRQRAVEQLIAGGLADLNQFASENKSNEFFATLFRLLQEQLGERLDCPAFSITEADADNRLISLGATPETLNSLRELFQACNQARYAPVQTPQELSAIAQKFKKVVGELQNLKT